MAELAPAQVYAPRTLQVWRTLLNWLAFIFQILLQIVRGTSSVSQLFSSLSVRLTSASPAFKPLPLVQLSDAVVSDADDNVACPDLHQPATIEKLTVVLDLDETLVCAYETCSLPAIVRNQATEAGLKCFELECISVDKEGEGKQKVNHVTVFERPGLHEFLEKISEFADLVLFTAGLEGYARPLIDRIDLGNRFSLRLYRPSTISTKYREHVKDLSCLTKDLCRTVIVDNNPFSFLLQPLNGIPCVPFSAGQPEDEQASDTLLNLLSFENQLIEVLLPLLKHLSLQKDVRPVLYEKFHMPEWFQKHGVPTSGWTL